MNLIKTYKEELLSDICIAKSNNKELKFIHCLGAEPVQGAKSKEQAQIHKAIISYVKLNEPDVIIYHSVDPPWLVRQIKKINPKIKNIVQMTDAICGNCDMMGGKCCVDKFLDEYRTLATSKDTKADFKEYLLFVKKNLDEFLSIDVDAFVCSEKSIFEFAKFLLSNAPPKLYIVSAPSGYGKSTFVDRLRYLGIRQLPKVTTRKPRPSEQSDKSMEFISGEEYKELLRDKEIVSHAERNGNAYGIRKALLEEIFNGYQNYVIDRDFNAASEIKIKYNEKVRLVALFPSLSFAGFGLEERINKLNIPKEGFGSFIEELEFLKRSRYTLQDSKDRLKHIVREAREFERNIPFCDIVLDKYNVEENESLLLEKMSE